MHMLNLQLTSMHSEHNIVPMASYLEINSSQNYKTLAVIPKTATSVLSSCSQWLRQVGTRSGCFPRFFQSLKTLQMHWEAVWMKDISTPGLCASLEQVLELSDHTALAGFDGGVNFFLLCFILWENEVNTVHVVTLWLCGVCGLFIFPRLGIF